MPQDDELGTPRSLSGAGFDGKIPFMSEQKKKTAVPEKKAIAARVSLEAFENCQRIADQKEWSLSQVIDKAMADYKVPEDGK